MARLVAAKSIGELIDEKKRSKDIERESLVAKARAIDEKSTPSNKAYSNAFNPIYSGRSVDMTSDDRNDIIRTATKVFKDKLTKTLGKGGTTVEFDNIKVVEAQSDVDYMNSKLINKALMTFAVKIDTETKPLVAYGAVDYDFTRDRDERYRVIPHLKTAKDETIEINDAEIKRFAQSNSLAQNKSLNLDSVDWRIARKLVLYDFSENPPRYVTLPVENAERAKTILASRNLRIATKHLGPEAGNLGHVYELVCLPPMYPEVKKILAAAGEWKEISRTVKNDEFDGPHVDTKKTEEVTQFPGRSREKNPEKHQDVKGEDPRFPAHSDEDKAMKGSDSPKSWEGRSLDKNKDQLPSKTEINRKVKNDEFDGNHTTDDRTEKVTEWPGRSLEKTHGKEVDPKNMLRYEQKKVTAQAPGGGMGMPGEMPLDKELQNDTGMDVLPGEDPNKNKLTIEIALPPGMEDMVDVQSPMDSGPTSMPVPAMEAKARKWVMSNKRRAKLLVLTERDARGNVRYAQSIPDDIMMGPETPETSKTCVCGGQPCVCGAGDMPEEAVCQSPAECLETMQTALDDLRKQVAPETAMGDSPLTMGDADVGVMSIVTDAPAPPDMMDDNGDDADDAKPKSDSGEKKPSTSSPESDKPKAADSGEKKKEAPKSDEKPKTEDKKSDEKKDEKKDDGEKDEMEKKAMSIVAQAEYRGRRFAKYLEYLDSCNYKVSGRIAGCFTMNDPHNRKVCETFGCSNSPACNQSRGIELMRIASAEATTKAKSNPTPDVSLQHRPMDGMHKRDSGGGEHVVPTERARSESEVRKAQAMPMDPTKTPTEVIPQPMAYEETMADAGTPWDQLTPAQREYVMKQWRNEDYTLQDAGQTKPKMTELDFQQMRGASTEKKAITTSGTGNDVVKIPQKHRPMDGMHQRSDGQGKSVTPTDEAGSGQVVPGITKNADENITDEHDKDDMDGMTRTKKYSPKSNSEATRKASVLDELKNSLSGPEDTPSRRAYAQKKVTAQKALEMKKKASLDRWSRGEITTREKRKIDAKAEEEFKAELERLASTMGRDKASSGGDGDEKSKGQEKYDHTKDGKNWFDRASDGQNKWKGDSTNYSPTVKGEESKNWKDRVDSDEWDNADKWVGRPADKLPYEGTKLEPQKVKEDEDKAMKGKDDPKSWEGRSLEKSKSPSKDPAAYMMKDSQKKVVATDEKESVDEKTAVDDKSANCSPKQASEEKEGAKKVESTGAFVNAMKLKKNNREAADGVKKVKTSYEDEKNENISTKMPDYEYKAHLEKGRSDEEGQIKEFHKMQPTLKSEKVDEMFKEDGKFLKEGQKIVKAIDDDVMSAETRRRHIDNQYGRVSHVGMPFKQNDVNFSANDMVYDDLRHGRKPNGASPYDESYYVDRALRGLRTRDFLDSTAAFRGIVASEEGRYMSDHQKMRFAKLLAGYGLVVDDEVVKKALKDGNLFEKSLRAEKTK